MRALRILPVLLVGAAGCTSVLGDNYAFNGGLGGAPGAGAGGEGGAGAPGQAGTSSAGAAGKGAGGAAGKGAAGTGAAGSGGPGGVSGASGGKAGTGGAGGAGASGGTGATGGAAGAAAGQSGAGGTGATGGGGSSGAGAAGAAGSGGAGGEAGAGATGGGGSGATGGAGGSAGATGGAGGSTGATGGTSGSSGAAQGGTAGGGGSGAQVCGDGVKSGTEACDGIDLGGASCTTAVSQSTGGTLKCTGKCTFDTSGCACAQGPTNCGTACVDLLTDGANCGACGRSCLGAMCSAAMCAATPLAMDTGIVDIAIDDTTLYVLGNGQTNAYIRTSAKDGTNSGPFSIDSSLSSPHQIVQDGDSVFVRAGDQGNWSILQFSKQGSVETVLESAPGGSVSNASDLAVSGNYAFFITSDNLHDTSTIELAYRSKMGTNLTVANFGGSGVLRGMAAGANAADTGAQAYFGFSNGSKASIQTVNNIGSPPMDLSPLAEAQKFVVRVALVGSQLYWVDQRLFNTPGAIRTMKMDGSGYMTLLSNAGIDPHTELAADSTGIYWVDSTANTINVLSPDGMVSKVVLSAASLPYSLRLDAQYLYFVLNPSTPTSAVMRVAR